MKTSHWLGVYLALSLLTLAIYWQGLHSAFLLDDAPNLSAMGDHLSLGYWHNVFIFLLEGRSGPTGRPLSLLSFYLNSSSYPADPWSFKLINVIIHIINGALITLILHKLTQLINMDKQQAKWLILLSVAFWLLHPFQITTVLYVIQRMTELSAMFILLGLLIYIHGRERLYFTTKPFKYFLFLGFCVWGSMTLAMLSKETGALLLAYVLVIEYFLIRPFHVKTTSIINYWLSIFIIFPFIGVFGYIYWGGLASNAFDSRPFTLEQRLLTESRIIFDYLGNITVPGFTTPSLFHDGYPLSTGWLQPWTTLSSSLGLLVLSGTALLMRTRQPILSFGIFWFLASHLIESTVVPLELYYEHRNYLAMLGPLLIIAHYMYKATKYKIKFKKPIYFFIAIFSLLIVINLLHNTLLWNKPLALITTWVKDHPESVRIVETLDGFEQRENAKILNPEIRNILHSLNAKKERPFFLLLRQLMYSCNAGTLTENELYRIQNQLSHTENELHTAKVLHEFIKSWQSGKCSSISSTNMISFLENMLIVPKAELSTLMHVSYFGLSEAWKTKKNLDKTIYYLTKAYEKKPSLGLLLGKVEYFASAGLYDEASATLNDLSLLKTTFRKRLVIALRKEEIETVRNSIRQHQQLSKF